MKRKMSTRKIVGKSPRRRIRSPMHGGFKSTTVTGGSNLQATLSMLRTMQPFVYSRANQAAQKATLMGGATYFSKLVDGSGRNPEAKLTPDVPLDKIVDFVKQNPLNQAQVNGAISELRYYLIAMNNKLSVSEQTNAARAILGLAVDYNTLPVAKLPQLQSVIATNQPAVTEIMPVVELSTRSETPDPETTQELVTAVLTNPQPIADTTVPTETLQETANIVMALVPAVQTAQVIQQVQEIPTVTTPRQQLVYFLLACIPVLLNSLMYENKTLGYILLTFFFGLMYRDPSLVNDMKRVLQALTNTR